MDAPRVLLTTSAAHAARLLPRSGKLAFKRFLEGSIQDIVAHREPREIAGLSGRYWVVPLDDADPQGHDPATTVVIVTKRDDEIVVTAVIPPEPAAIAESTDPDETVGASVLSLARSF